MLHARVSTAHWTLSVLPKAQQGLAQRGNLVLGFADFPPVCSVCAVHLQVS